MDIAVLSVRFTGDTSAMDRAFRSATSSAKSFQSTVDGLTNFTINVDTSPFDRALDGAVRKAQAAASEIRSAFSGLDADMNVNVEVTGVDTSLTRLNQVDDKAQQMQNQWGNSVNVHCDVVGVEAAMAKLDAYDAKAEEIDGDTITSNIDVDTMGAMASLTAFDAAKIIAGKDIHVNVDVDTGGATTQLIGFTAVTTAANAALQALPGGISVGSTGFVTMAGAIVVAAAALTPLLGALAVVGALGAAAAIGLGLIGAAAYVMVQGLYDGGAAFEALSERASGIGDQIVQQLGPASLTIADIGMEALNVAEQYIPMLGPAASAVATQMQASLGAFFEWLSGVAAQNAIGTLFAAAAPIVGDLTSVVTSLGQVIIMVLSAAAPYAVLLADYIANIAEEFAAWAESAQGQEQIVAAIEAAIPIFQALWDMVVQVGGALLAFSMEHASSVGPALQIVADVLTVAIGAFSSLMGVLGPVGIAAAALAPLFMGAVVVFGAVASGIGSLVGAIGGVVTAFQAIAVAVGISSLALLGIVAVVAAVAVAAYLIYDNWGAISQFFSDLWTSVVEAFNSAVAWITETLSSWGTSVSTTFTSVQTTISTVLTSIATFFTDTWNSIYTTVSTILTSIVTTISTVLTTIGTTVMTVLYPVIEVFSTVFNTALTIVTTVLTAIAVVVGVLLLAIIGVVVLSVQGIVAAMQAGWTLVQTGAQVAWDALVAIVTAVWAVIGPVVQAGIDLIVTTMQTAWDLITAAAQAAWDLVSSIVTTVWTGITTAVQTGVDTIASIAQAGWDAISAAAQAAWDAFLAIITAIWDQIGPYVETAISAVSATLDSWWATIQTAAETAWSAVSTTITTWWTTISETVTTWLTTISTTMDTWWTTISTSVTTWWTAIWTTIETWWTTISETVTTWLTTIWETMETWWTTISEAVTVAWTAIWTTISDIWTQISTTVSEAIAGLTETLQAGWDAIVEAATSFGTMLYDALYNGFWTAVAAGADAVAQLLRAVESAMTSIGDPLGVAGMAGDAASALEGLASFHDGGVVGVGVNYYAKGGMGGLGTGSPNARMHVWNEQMGNEAYIAERGDRQAQLRYLQTAAGWFGMTVAPRNGPRGKMGGDAGHEHFRRGGIVGRDTGEGLGATHWGVEGYIAERADAIAAAVGGSWNTYYGHGEPGGSWESVTFDVWGPGGRGDPLDSGGIDTAASMGIGYSDIMYAIANGYMYRGEWFPFPEDPHYDHTHLSYGGDGSWGAWFGAIACVLANTARGIFQAAVEGLAELARSGISAIDQDIIESPLVFGVDTIEQWITDLINKLPGCSSGTPGQGSDQGGWAQHNMELGRQMAEAYGWTGPEFDCLAELWTRESGWDETATNPDSGAYGIPQALGHGDIGSSAESQIAWGLDYISGRYGSPCAALSFHDANGWYAQGGLAIPCFAGGGVFTGNSPGMAMLEPGERVLTPQQTRNFDDMVSRGGGDMYNDVQININIEGAGGNADEIAEKAARRAREEVLGVMSQLHERGGSVRRSIGRGWTS